MRRVLRGFVAMLLGLALWATPAESRAVELYEADQTWMDLGGDIKTFFVGIYPYEHDFMPEDPLSQGAIDARLKLSGGVGDWVSFKLHHSLSASSGMAMDLGGFSTGGAGGDPFPQALDLSWNIEDGAGYQLGLRVDRAMATIKLPSLDLTLGRQPISFGSTFFFNPLDLVAPFSPTVIDREYKPGIDALRADVYFGMSGKLTLVAAYAGDWELDQTILAARAGATISVVDIGIFLGRVRGDTVLGVDSFIDFFGLAIRGEGTVTYPEEGGEPFVRAALGSDHNFGNGFNVAAEIYVQTLGADDPADYLDVAASKRFERGELWAMGKYYAAVSGGYELLPIVNLSGFAMVNLVDGSAQFGPSLNWSVSDEVAFGAGAFFTAGERPEDVDLDAITARQMEQIATGQPPPASPAPEDLFVPRSEFGMSPAVVFIQLKAYF